VAVRVLDETAAMSTSWRLFVADRETRERAFVDHGYGGVDLRWSSRAHRLLVVRGAALLFDADTRQVWSLPVKDARAAAIDADGKRAALETSEGLAMVMLASKDRPTVLSPRDDPPATQLALAGDRLAAVTHDGDVTVWNVVTGEPEATWNAGFAPENVAWIGDGRRLALSGGHVLRLFDADGSRPVTLTALLGPTGASVLAEPR
jgi:dipeptidyl aminopeptidase/acylaminoacyl peptidase